VKKHYRNSSRPHPWIHSQSRISWLGRTSAGEITESNYFTNTTATCQQDHHWYQELTQTLGGVYLTPPAASPEGVYLTPPASTPGGVYLTPPTNVKNDTTPPRSPSSQRHPKDQLPPLPYAENSNVSLWNSSKTM